MALDARVPAAVVDEVDHVVVEGFVFWLDPCRAQDRDSRAGAQQRQGDIAVTFEDGNAQRGVSLLVPRFQVCAGAEEDLVFDFPASNPYRGTTGTTWERFLNGRIPPGGLVISAFPF